MTTFPRSITTTFSAASRDFSSRLRALQTSGAPLTADDRDAALSALDAVAVLGSRCPLDLDGLELPDALGVLRGWLLGGAPDQLEDVEAGPDVDELTEPGLDHPELHPATLHAGPAKD